MNTSLLVLGVASTPPCMNVKAFGDRILGVMIDRPDGEYKATKSGLLIAEKDASTESIRPRWFQISSVGERIDWVKPGDYVLVAHGRWSNGITLSDDSKVWLLDNKEILGVSDTNPIE